MKYRSISYLKRFITDFSGVSLAIVGFFLTLHPKLREHPSPLIGIGLLFEAYYFLQQYRVIYLCEYGFLNILTNFISVVIFLMKNGFVETYQVLKNKE